MTQDTYRFAFEEANSELREISAKFEGLLARKEQVEQVIEALRPLLSDAETVETIIAQQSAEPAPFLVQQSVSEVVPEAVPEIMQEPVPEPIYAEQASDPFQRRIENALRHGFGSKDTRVMPSAMNGLLSRA